MIKIPKKAEIKTNRGKNFGLDFWELPGKIVRDLVLCVDLKYLNISQLSYILDIIMSGFRHKSTAIHKQKSSNHTISCKYMVVYVHKPIYIALSKPHHLVSTNFFAFSLPNV